MSQQDLVLLLVSFIVPPLIVIFWQAVLNRLLRRSPQLLTMMGMVLGYPTFFAVVLAFPFQMERDGAFFLYLFLIYSFSAYTYFHVFNMSETSRRVRMISAIGRTGSHLKTADLDDLYDDKAMIEARLQRLVALGQITEQNGMFYPKGKLFTRTATCFYALGVLLSRPWAPMKKYIEGRQSENH